MGDGGGDEMIEPVVGLGGVGGQGGVLQLASSLAHADRPSQVIADLRGEDRVAAVDGVLHVAQHGPTFARAVASSQQLGLDGHTAFALVYSALHHLARGEVATARQQLQSAQWLSDRGGWPRARVYANLHLGLLCARLEDREELHRCVSRLTERRLNGTWMGAAALTWLHARICLLDRHTDAALPLLQQARDALGAFGAWWTEDAWLFEGQALLLAGQRSSAHGLLVHLQMRSRVHDRPLLRASALAMEALLARFDGRTVLATGLVEHARPLARGSVLEPALSMLLARWRSGCGDPLPGQGAPAAQDRSDVDWNAWTV